MSNRKISAAACLVWLASALLATCPVAQAQPVQRDQARPAQRGYGGYGVAGAPQNGQRPPPPRWNGPRPDYAQGYGHGYGYGYGGYRPLPPRPPGMIGPPPRYYRPPVFLSSPAIVVGSVLPYGFPGYPLNDWAYYNLPSPCCGQYWVPYGPSFLLVSPDGVVLQVFTP